MKILSFITDKAEAINKTEGRVTEVKGRYHRLSHQNGLIEVSFNLSPDQRAAFDQKAATLEAVKNKAIASATDTMNAKVSAARRESEAAVSEARTKYEAELFALFTEFGKIPTREQLITNDTPVGHVVRLPESAIVQTKVAKA